VSFFGIINLAVSRRMARAIAANLDPRERMAKTGAPAAVCCAGVLARPALSGEGEDFPTSRLKSSIARSGGALRKALDSRSAERRIPKSAGMANALLSLEQTPMLSAHREVSLPQIVAVSSEGRRRERRLIHDDEASPGQRAHKSPGDDLDMILSA
jgi:hypothetical protein